MCLVNTGRHPTMATFPVGTLDFSYSTCFFTIEGETLILNTWCIEVVKHIQLMLFQVIFFCYGRGRRHGNREVKRKLGRNDGLARHFLGM